MLGEQELARIRKIAADVRRLKELRYREITWSAAIDDVLSSTTQNEEDFYRQKALLQYFLDEERSATLSSLELFLEGLDSAIAELKEHAKGYAISENERLAIRQKVEHCLREKPEATDRDSAFRRYSLLIDKAFLSVSLDELLATLKELSDVLEKFFPRVFMDVYVLCRCAERLDSVVAVAAEPVTADRVAEAIGIGPDEARLFLYRLAQIGVFEKQRKGRKPLYRFCTRAIDVNRLRREWDWLWAQPHARLSLKVYERD